MQNALTAAKDRVIIKDISKMVAPFAVLASNPFMILY